MTERLASNWASVDLFDCELIPQSEVDWRAMSRRANEAVSRYTWDDAVDAFEKALFDAIDRETARKRG